MTRQLRSGKGRNALILANGGVLSYQHVVCLSSQPNKGPYPDNRALKIANKPKPSITAEAEGEAVIEVSVSQFVSGSTNPVDIHGRVLAKGNPFTRVCDRSVEERSPLRCEPRGCANSDTSIVGDRGAHWE